MKNLKKTVIVLNNNHIKLAYDSYLFEKEKLSEKNL